MTIDDTWQHHLEKMKKLDLKSALLDEEIKKHEKIMTTELEQIEYSLNIYDSMRSMLGSNFPKKYEKEIKIKKDRKLILLRKQKLEKINKS